MWAARSCDSCSWGGTWHLLKDCMAEDQQRLRLRWAVRKLLCILHTILCSEFAHIRMSAQPPRAPRFGDTNVYCIICTKDQRRFSTRVQINCKLGMLKVCLVTFFHPGVHSGCTSQPDRMISAFLGKMLTFSCDWDCWFVPPTLSMYIDEFFVCRGSEFNDEAPIELGHYQVNTLTHPKP